MITAGLGGDHGAGFPVMFAACMGLRHGAVEWLRAGVVRRRRHICVSGGRRVLALDNVIGADGGPDGDSVVPRICLRMPRTDTELSSAAATMPFIPEPMMTASTAPDTSPLTRPGRHFGAPRPTFRAVAAARV
jgi:hypothetical protein